MHKRAPDFKEFIQEFDNIDEGGGSSVQQFLENFYFECRVKNLSPKTISGYGERLQHFYKFLKSRKIPFEEITKSHIQSYILSMKDQVSDHTINGRIRILRLFFNYLQKEDFLNNGNPMNGIKLIRAEKKFPEVIGIKEIESLLSIANKRTFTGYRNYLMLLILWDSMIRLGELRYLKIDDIDLKSGVIRVFGKGRKERFIPLGTRTIKAIHHYLIKFRNQIKQRQVQQIFERLSEKSGIKVNPHKVRHSAATFWIKQGGPMSILQKLPLIIVYCKRIATPNITKVWESDIVVGCLTFLRDLSSFSPFKIFQSLCTYFKKLG